MSDRTQRQERLLETEGGSTLEAAFARAEPHGALLTTHADAAPTPPAVAEPAARAARGCGPSQGSLWGTAFNMCTAILGAGALSLPAAVGAMGLLPAVALLAFTALATHFSVVLLVETIVATGTRSFEDLTRHVFGRWNGRLVELAIVLFQFGTLVAYTVAIGGSTSRRGA